MLAVRTPSHAIIVLAAVACERSKDHGGQWDRLVMHAALAVSSRLVRSLCRLCDGRTWRDSLHLHKTSQRWESILKMRGIVIV